MLANRQGFLAGLCGGQLWKIGALANLNNSTRNRTSLSPGKKHLPHVFCVLGLELKSQRGKRR
jgi:hypothetical protein